MFALAKLKRLEMLQFDVSTAFLNGEIKEQIFMEAPEAVKVKENQCLKLIKALYGLKQAPKCWNDKMDATLVELGLEATQSDRCLYANENRTIYLMLYVDDGIIFSQTLRDCQKLADLLKQRFKIKILSGDLFLSPRDRRGFSTHLAYF